MVWLPFHWSYGYLKLYFLGAKNKRFYKDFGSIYFIFFQFFLLNLILLIALSNVMEQFINDTLHIFGFELMSIQLFNIRITTSPRFIFILPHKRLYSMECTSLIAYDSFLWKIHKTHHSVKEMGFAAHFRYNWMEPLFTNQYCIFLLSLLRCKPTRCIYCAFHLDCYWSLEPCQLRLGLRFLKYILTIPKCIFGITVKKCQTNMESTLEFR
jgi:hypothetical protein